MKIDKILKINGENIHIISDNLTLELGAAGRAIFVVLSETALDGIAELNIGLDREYELFFSGYIESSRQIDEKQQRLVVREFSAVLDKRLPLSMRNTNAIDVLEEIGNHTGLAFNLEKADWNQQAIPYFINIGSGREALQLLARELDIKNFVYQSQANGVVYVGSLNACRLDEKVIAVNAKFFKDISVAGAGCPLVPGFRPGRRLRIGNGNIVSIEKIVVSGETMRINWQ